jgi:hypothetical protein
MFVCVCGGCDEESGTKGGGALGLQKDGAGVRTRVFVPPT